jgi:hypothetical protein
MQLFEQGEEIVSANALPLVMQIRLMTASIQPWLRQGSGNAREAQSARRRMQRKLRLAMDRAG